MSPQEFEALYAGLRQLRETKFVAGAAMATLLRTRGPVFRRAGARMLVFGNGRVVRGLSAGCPEADIAQHALAVIRRDEACLLRYDRERGYDALLELGCGGELEVLVEPLRTEPDLRYADAVARCLRDRRPAWLMTAFATDGRCLARPRRLIWDGQLRFDELSDARLVHELVGRVEHADASMRPVVLEMPAREGTQQVLLERLQPELALTLLGINTTTLALARFARQLGWRVELVDHRSDAPVQDAPEGTMTLHASPRDLETTAVLDARTAVVVMTHNFERDLEYLAVLSRRNLAYLGAVGSRQRVAKMRDALGSTLTPLRAPAGLDLAAETPEEIALSIAAEIQAMVNGRGGGGLSDHEGPIH